MLSKKPSNNSYSNIKSPTPLLILIPMILSLHGKDIKEQTSEIFQILFMSHSLLIRKIIKERPRWRYSKNKSKDDGPLPPQRWQEGVEQGSLVGPFIFSNPQTQTIKIPKLQKVLPPFPVKAKEYIKETRTPVLLLKQVNLPMNISPSFEKFKTIPTPLTSKN